MASPRPDRLAVVDRVLAPLTWVVAAFAIAALFVGPQLIGAERAPGAPPAYPATSGGPSGEEVFGSAGCGSCHTLAAAGATGTVGPNLDEVKPSTATVADVVASGRAAMPSFAGDLSAAEIDAVAQFVAQAAGGQTP